MTQAYYDAVLSERLVTIAEATLEQAGATLKQTQAGFDAGTQPEFEVLRARVSRDNQSPVLIRQRANRDVALLRLKQLLDLPADYPLQLADALGDEALPPPPVFAERVVAVERTLGVPDGRGDRLAADATSTLPDRTAVAEAAPRRPAARSVVEARRSAERCRASRSTRSTRAIAYPAGVVPTSIGRTGRWAPA